MKLVPFELCGSVKSWRNVACGFFARKIFVAFRGRPGEADLEVLCPESFVRAPRTAG